MSDSNPAETGHKPPKHEGPPGGPKGPKHDIEQAHRKAAEHHERAAKHHRAAADAYRDGSPEKAAAYTAAASGEWYHALKHTTEASKHYSEVMS